METEGRTFHVTIVTLFEGFFEDPLATSLLGKAVEQGTVRVEMLNPRGFTSDVHRTVDDTPYGGGPGMVLKPEPMVAAIERARQGNPGSPVILLTPQGQTLDARMVSELAQGNGLILVCGRYEGFDERIRAYVDRQISIGDYVLSGGEPAALVIIDAVARLLAGVLGNRESTSQESFSQGMLEYPQYTRPVEFRGERVPEILLSGDHGRVESWRRAQALERTRRQRPALFAELELTEFDRRSLQEFPAGLDVMENDRGRETDHTEN
ncbi:MAG: tRNA (guanosine(37)-N1)-methyltransferase TrmD [Bradymonadales bacterium]|nr:tRNA (guanosine(37)-N1)-methyltransferase TrmD [Bradymonadales bacterium]